jgi:hypothetical protein
MSARDGGKGMKRIVVAGLVALLVGCGLFRALAVDKDTGNVQFKGQVLTIVEWINNKQDPTTPTGLDDWNNTNITAAESDSVAVFRLVTNTDLVLSAPTQSVLTHGTTGETLATYYQLTTDGNGSTTTGFLPTVTGHGVGSLLYVGGGSTAWETAQSLSPGTFLGSGKTVTHVNRDGALLLTVTVRGLNGEDLGADSDLTEAPDVGTATDYTANLVLRASYTP